MKKQSMVFPLLIFGLLLGLGAGILCSGDREFSENENRYLNVRPQITVQGMLDGKNQEQINDFLSDQFPGRDFFMSFATAIKRCVGYEDIGGVYLGKDHFYFEKVGPEDVRMQSLERNLASVKRFLQRKDLSAKVLLVPSPGTVMKDWLPQGAKLYPADDCYERAKELLGADCLIDLRRIYADALEDSAAGGTRRDLYYHTDHHWTTYGAWLAYEEYCRQKGWEAQSYEDLQPETVTDAFYGTLYSKVMDGTARPDEIELLRNVPEVTVELPMSSSDGDGLRQMYCMDRLEVKDKYAVFFGGNEPLMIVRNVKPCNEGRTLLLVKDSFANCMIPELMWKYDTVVVLDLRYYNGDTDTLCEEYSFTDFLLLYEMSNFINDKNLFKLGGQL